MKPSAALRLLAPVLLLALALAACDREPERGGLGPRGTALPPPQPGEPLPR